jgi:hypothetical protein
MCKFNGLQMKRREKYILEVLAVFWSKRLLNRFPKTKTCIKIILSIVLYSSEKFSLFWGKTQELDIQKKVCV